MVIGVDAGALSVRDERLKVGVHRVTLQLLKHFAKIDKKNTYSVYSFHGLEKGILRTLGPRMKNIVVTPERGWSKIWLPLELWRHPVDIFLGLSQQIPFIKTSYNIGFIYDLAFLFSPDAYGPSYSSLKNQTDTLVARSDHIITISQSSKSDIVNHYKIASKQVSVCYPGVDERFFSKEIFIRPRLASQGEALGNSPPYFLFVGSLNKAKDLPLAIESLAYFLKKIKKPFDFLLVGGEYWPDPKIDESIDRFKLRTRVRKIGFVPDEKLPEYYRGAVAFFTTSYREGFCLPAVESMACGTPVVSINRGAMKEVVGGGGIIASIEPQDIADALHKITDKRVHEKLQQEALKQSKQYSWKTFAKCIYEQILAY